MCAMVNFPTLVKYDVFSCASMILVGKIFQTLVEAQENTSYFTKVGQFTMAHMFQYQFLN